MTNDVTGATKRANLRDTLLSAVDSAFSGFSHLVLEVESTGTNTLISSHSHLEKILKISQLVALFLPTFFKLIWSFINFE